VFRFDHLIDQTGGSGKAHPALLAAGVGPGSEVITVPMTFVATVAAILYCGATPVFVDVDLQTGNVLTDRLEQAIGPKTRAIMLAHTLGNPFAADQVVDMARRRNLYLIEDNCDALGSTYEGERTGTFGDLATQSFYPPHHLTMGEGGAVLMQSGRLKRIAESFRDWGRDCWCPSGKDNTCSKRFGWQLGTLAILVAITLFLAWRASFRTTTAVHRVHPVGQSGGGSRTWNLT